MYSGNDTLAGGFPHSDISGYSACLSAPPSLSQTTTSFIAFNCLGIHRMRLFTWSYIWGYSSMFWLVVPNIRHRKLRLNWTLDSVSTIQKFSNVITCFLESIVQDSFEIPERMRNTIAFADCHLFPIYPLTEVSRYLEYRLYHCSTLLKSKRLRAILANARSQKTLLSSTTISRISHTTQPVMNLLTSDLDFALRKHAIGVSTCDEYS